MAMEEGDRRTSTAMNLQTSPVQIYLKGKKHTMIRLSIYLSIYRIPIVGKQIICFLPFWLQLSNAGVCRIVLSQDNQASAHVQR